MTINDIYNKIIESKSSQYSIYFIERIRENGNYSYKVIKSKRNNKIGQNLRKSTKEVTKNIINRDIINYEDELSQKRGKIQTLDSLKIPNFNSVIKSCNLISANSATPSNQSILSRKVNDAESLSKNLWGYIIRIDMGDVFIYLFKKYTPASLLEWNKSYFNIKSGIITPINNRNIFSIDKYYDGIIMRMPNSTPNITPMFIVNRIEFEEFFSFRDHYIKYINDNKFELVKSGRIDKVDEFVERCSKNFQFSLRLSRILQKGKIHSMDMTEVKKNIERNGMDVKLENDIIVYNKKYAEDILDILDDSYLYSKVTKTNYKSTGKEERK